MPNGYQQADASYKFDELVVALPYRDLIEGTLTTLGLKATRLGDSAPLNLALLKLGVGPEVTEGLRTAVKREKERTNVTRAGAVPEGGDEANLDRVLYCLRRMIGADNGGWFPDMGKNRVLVFGQPHLSGTGEKYPTPASRPVYATPEHHGAGVRVGVLDTKVYAHPDLAGRYFASDAFRLDGTEIKKPKHFLGHATFVAGLIRRYAPGAEIVVRAVLGDDDATASAWDVAREMVAFKGTGVKVICMAMGAYTDDNQEPLVLSRAVQVLGPDVLIVAPTGNRPPLPVRQLSDGSSVPVPLADVDPLLKLDRQRPMWPAALTDVVAIGAVDSMCKPASFSPSLPWMNLTTLGVNVVSTFLPGEVEVVKRPPDTSRPETFTEPYAEWSGTSFALAIFVGRLAAKAAENGGDVKKALDALHRDAENGVGDLGGGAVRLPQPPPKQ
jgi:hypothetical protein